MHTDAEDSQSSTRDKMKRLLRMGELEERYVELETEESTMPTMEVMSPPGAEDMGINLKDMFGNLFPKKTKRRRIKVADAREQLIEQEAQKLVDMDEVHNLARQRTEQNGIIFIDEIDKVASPGGNQGPEVSREGVQRDILPIVEGSTVNTKYGPVKTDHILFIAAGAFHVAKPSDLIPELQGRFPIRVELDSLTEADFVQILTEPRNALLSQYRALMETEGLKLDFSDDAIKEVARIAAQVNEQTENIGARRLHTIIEKLLEEVSFDAPEIRTDNIEVDTDMVRERLEKIVASEDLSRFIL